MARQYPFPTERYELVGRVIRSHGINGEIKVLPVQGSVEDFENYSRVALVAADGRMTDVLDIKRSKVQGKQFILKLDTIDTKDEADLTVSMGVLGLRDEHRCSGSHSSGEDLVGTSVTTTDNELVGTVERIDHTGAHPLLIVRKDRQEYLIPLVDAIIVSHTDGKMIIDPPPGLLEINERDQ
ncbi:MAG: ribosome maturation factor RimM [Desulfofustis sp.]